jgi:protein O-mannosyl-transferase
MNRRSLSLRPALPDRQSAWLALLLAGVTAAHAGATRVGFVFDDVDLIVRDPFVHQLQPPAAYFSRAFWDHPGREGQSAYFRPLTALSFTLDWLLGGGQAWVFHATNVILHLLVTAACFALAISLGAQPIPAAVCSGLFAIFPRLTESVTWISGRTDVLAALPGMLALLVRTRAPRSSLGAWGGGLLVFLSMAAKEIGVAFGVGLLVLEATRLLRREATGPVALARAAPVLLALTVYLGLRRVVLDVPTWPVPPVQALAALGTLATMSAFPWTPNLQIGTPGEHPWPAVLVGVASLVLVGAGARRWADRLSPPQWMLAGLGLSAVAAVTLLPTSPTTLTADRFLYVPVLAASCLAATRPGLASTWSRLVALAVLASFAVATWLRVSVWTDELALWESTTAQASARNAGVRLGLANVYLDRFRVSDALRVTEEGVGIAPDDALLRSTRAALLSRLGRHDEAIAEADALSRARPDWPAALRNAVVFRLRAGRLDDAAHLLSLWPAGPRLVGIRGELEAALAAARDASAARRSIDDFVRAASLWESLGALDEARRLRRQVARSAEGSPALQRDALVWLMHKAENGESLEAAQTLFEGGYPPDEIEAVLIHRLGRHGLNSAGGAPAP